MKKIYFDNSATTPICQESLEEMAKVSLDIYGNPSSLHGLGLQGEKGKEKNRKVIAEILKVKDREIFFTSGGTESNNLAIKGIARRNLKRGKHIITTSIEHPATLFSCQALEREGFQVDYLGVNNEGIISLKELQDKIRDDTLLVSIMHVNNEIGAIMPLEKIGKIIKAKNPATFFHVDAVQSFCKLPCLPKSWQADLLSISSHKIHGPKGIGALYIREKTLIEPLFHGGGQEVGIRPGTENTPAIAGFAKAAAKYYALRSDNFAKVKELRNLFLEKVLAEIPEVKVNSSNSSAPYILNLSFAGVKGEVLLHTLKKDGIFVSTGSACHSKKQELSHVLVALGLENEDIEGALRFSFSPHNTKEEIEFTVEKLKTGVENLRKFRDRL